MRLNAFAYERPRPHATTARARGPLSLPLHATPASSDGQRETYGHNRSHIAPTAAMLDLPVPRFDTFYRHSELTRLLFDYADEIGRAHV